MWRTKPHKLRYKRQFSDKPGSRWVEAYLQTGRFLKSLEPSEQTLKMMSIT